MAEHVAVVGVGMTEATSPRRQTRSKMELCHAAVRDAMQMAGVEVGEVDGVVFGSIDGFEATNLSARWMGDAIGTQLGAPVLHVNTGGSTGGNVFNVARNLVASGDHEVVVCVGPPTFDGPHDLQAVINTASPFVIEQPLGIGAIHMGAFYASAYLERFGATEADLAGIAVKNHDNALHNPYAHLRKALTVDDVLASRPVTWPLRLHTTCPVSSGASALVLVSGRVAARLDAAPVWIRAAGSIGDTYLGGGRRDFSEFQALGLLAERTFREAAIKDPSEELEVFELFSPYAPFELLEAESLGLCGPGEAVEAARRGEFTHEGSLPLNLSGGVLCTNPGVAAQLAPYAYTTLQLLGQAAGRQVDGARRGVAHSTGGNFFQFHTLAVLERD